MEPQRQGVQGCLWTARGWAGPFPPTPGLRGGGRLQVMGARASAAYLCLSPEVAVSPEAAALPQAPSRQAQRKAGAGLAPLPRMLSCAR